MASSTLSGVAHWRGKAHNDETDAAHVARAQDDVRAFAPLYERYVDQIFRYCVVRLGSRVEAEDAAATIFAQALAALPRFQDQGDSFRRWLFTIAHNIVAGNLRARRDLRPLDDAWAVQDDASSPERAAVDAFESARIHAALSLLPDAQRRVVELRLAGLTGPEMAAVLGRSHAAVKMLQLRAIDRLRVLLGPVNGEPGVES
jgi:RNA polymerase sigma factor (sigma-70 family)